MFRQVSCIFGIEHILSYVKSLLTSYDVLLHHPGLIYTAEHEVNPEIPDYFTALYFGLTTLTTVGFGDIVPITPQGRTVVSGTILAGVGELYEYVVCNINDMVIDSCFYSTVCPCSHYTSTSGSSSRCICKWSDGKRSTGSSQEEEKKT